MYAALSKYNFATSQLEWTLFQKQIMQNISIQTDGFLLEI
jgi:hypothetical protein